jgi:hypothetical protein
LVFTQAPLHKASPGWHTHAPPTHATVNGVPKQTFPHPPQLKKSLERLRQVVPHRVVPAEQVQLPVTQIWLDAQTRPHPPQLFRSLCTSRHTPRHSRLPGAHWQTPPTQASVVAQAWAQAPQLRGSTSRLTHTPEQLVGADGGQVEVQAPDEHACPDGHASPHPPQLAGSVWRLTQVLPHRVVPAGHTQAPPWHVPRPQEMPQPPQLLESVPGLTQVLPQRICPGRHELRHSPKSHTWPAAQVRPQLPQLLGSDWRRTHWVPQRVKPAAQAHREFTHAELAPQETPQPPQLAASLAGLTQIPLHRM